MRGFLDFLLRFPFLTVVSGLVVPCLAAPRCPDDSEMTSHTDYSLFSALAKTLPAFCEITQCPSVCKTN